MQAGAPLHHPVHLTIIKGRCYEIIIVGKLCNLKGICLYILRVIFKNFDVCPDCFKRVIPIMSAEVLNEFISHFSCEGALFAPATC